MAATVGIRQRLESRDEVEAALHQLARGVGILRRAAQFAQVGAGDEHAGLAAAEDQAAQLAARFQLGDHRFQLAEHGLAERVGPAAGLIEGHESDVTVEDFQAKSRLRGLTHRCVLSCVCA